MRTITMTLFTLTLAVSLACAKPTQPDASNEPSSDVEAAKDEDAAKDKDKDKDKSKECDFTADPNKTYVGESPDQCATIKFACDEGKEYFADDCGCGCIISGG